MANALYDYARGQFAKAQINWETDTIKCVLVDSNYGSPNLSAATAVLADIPQTQRNYGTSGSAGVTLQNAAVVAGAVDSDDVTFTSVSAAAGVNIKAVVLYKDDGSANESNFPLVAWFDQGTGLPITPNGGDIIVLWDNGANRIFKL